MVAAPSVAGLLAPCCSMIGPQQAQCQSLTSRPARRLGRRRGLQWKCGLVPLVGAKVVDKQPDRDWRAFVAARRHAHIGRWRLQRVGEGADGQLAIVR